MLPKTGCGPEFAHELLELLSAIGVTTEHIETGEPRTEQHVVAVLREFRSAPYGFGERCATGVSDAKGGKMKGELCAGLSDQYGVFHVRRNAMSEAGDVPALRFSSRDQDHRIREARQCRFDGVEIRGFGIVPINNPRVLSH